MQEFRESPTFLHRFMFVKDKFKLKTHFPTSRFKKFSAVLMIPLITVSDKKNRPIKKNGCGFRKISSGIINDRIDHCFL
jgi:hypothetical protein